MAVKPENVFRRSVHKHLSAGVYQEKMNNPFNAGTPDDYYEGDKDIIWVEWKYLPKAPVRQFTPKLTPLQVHWLDRAYKNGRNVQVIVGTKTGGYILRHPNEWANPVNVTQKRLYSRKEIAEQIDRITTH